MAWKPSVLSSANMPQQHLKRVGTARQALRLRIVSFIQNFCSFMKLLWSLVIASALMDGGVALKCQLVSAKSPRVKAFIFVHNIAKWLSLEPPLQGQANYLPS